MCWAKGLHVLVFYLTHPSICSTMTSQKLWFLKKEKRKRERKYFWKLFIFFLGKHSWISFEYLTREKILWSKIKTNLFSEIYWILSLKYWLVKLQMAGHRFKLWPLHSTTYKIPVKFPFEGNISPSLRNSTDACLKDLRHYFPPSKKVKKVTNPADFFY